MMQFIETKPNGHGKKYDLENRLVKFAGDVILFLNNLPNNRAGSISVDS